MRTAVLAVSLLLLVAPVFGMVAPAAGGAPAPVASGVTVLTFEGDVVVGVPDETVVTPAVDDVVHAFAVPSGVKTLAFELAWGLHQGDPSVYAANDFDYSIEFGGAPLGWGGAASSNMPETSAIDNPNPGTYAVRIHPYVVANDHYVLKVTLDTSGFVPAPPQDVNGDSFVVIAVVDTGVNPYHDAFAGELYPRNTDADPTNNVDFTAHPSRYIKGFPASAPAIPLSLNAPTYTTAVNADRAVWSAVETEKLHWIPGTKIIGAWSEHDEGFWVSAPGVGRIQIFAPGTPILDEDGHGTATASIAAGNPGAWQTPEASCPECLLVVVKGFSGLAWALNQPWIDIVSNSWGTIGNAGAPPPVNPVHLFGDTHAMTRGAVERGQTILFASGNGYENAFLTTEQDYTSNEAGPSWVVRVGAVTTTGERPIVTDGTPVDLSSWGSGTIRAASETSLVGSQGFGGTSSATPYVASAFGRVLLEARKILGDTDEGARPGQVLAQGPAAGGLLADGKLTRAELREVVLKTADQFVSGGVGIVPPATTNSVTYTYVGGYGVSKLSATLAAVNVMKGTQAMPDRSDADAFFAKDYAIRDLIWGPYDRDGDGHADPHPLV